LYANAATTTAITNAGAADNGGSTQNGPDFEQLFSE
jgi:hypothetical protein